MKLSKGIKHLVESAGAYAAFYLFRVIGIDAASNLGGRIMATLGPRFGISRVAHYNLQKALPELSEAEREKIVKGVWENIGRVLGEFPHIPLLSGKKFHERVSLEGKEHLDAQLQAGKCGILFSGHFANWEIAPKTAFEHDLPLTLIYRPANNKAVDKLIRKSRLNSHNGMWPKGSGGGRQVARILKEGGWAGMLVDQKTNNGIAVPFFGRDAMTAPALAEFGRMFNAALVPARVVRKNGARFHVQVYPAIETAGRTNEEVMAEVNALFESWIREHPEQWLWLHKRWPDSKEGSKALKKKKGSSASAAA